VVLPSAISSLSEQQALAFFTSRYVILEPKTGAEPEPIGYLECLPRLLSSAKTNGCMYQAVCATALSALARERRDSPILFEARKKYAAALSRTNLALTDAQQALLDETLMAVHILGIFETAMSTTKDLTPWLNHAIGSATLIKMRGPKIFESRAGTALFYLSQGQMTICSLALRKDIFKFMPAYEIQRKKSNPSRHSLDIVFEIPGILEQLDTLLSDVDRCPLSLEQAVKPLLQKAA
jgi:hypothetical protein